MTIEPIENPDDPRLDDYRNVRDPEWIRRRDIFLAEGRRVVERLLTSSRFQVRSLMVTRPALDFLRGVVGSRDVTVYVVERSVLEQVAGARFHQGCVAVGELPVERSPEEVLAPLGGRARRLLVLERVADPDNIGGLFRNARAFGVDAVVLGPGCTHPLYRKAVRTSMGATLDLPFARAGSWPKALASLRAAGFVLIALTPRSEALDIASLGTTRPVPGRVALLLGGEGYGLSEEALAESDLRVRIPMAPGVDSLNVTSAAGIALHRLAHEDRRPAAGSQRSTACTSS